MMNYLVSMNRHLRITIFFILIFVSFGFLLSTGNLIFALLFFILLGLLIASNISHARNYSNVMEKSLEKACIKNNIVSDYSYLSDDFLTGIALNKSEEKIIFFRRFNVKDEFSPTLLNFKDIIECSIEEDGETIVKASNSSVIGRAMAGGVLFGGIGAAVGGLTGERVESQKIYKASLAIVVNDLDYPIYEINFLNSNMLVDRNSEAYREIYVDLNKWHKTISVIIKRNEKELNSKSV